MNIQEEKRMIYEMMHDVTQERRKLTDIYFGLKERLDFLFLQEQKGLEDLSLKGYADLHNKNENTLAINNIKREAEHIIQKIEKDNNIEESEKSIIPAPIIDDEKAKVRKKYSKVSSEKIIDTAATILKEEGIPLGLGDLFNRVQERLETSLSKKSFESRYVKTLMEKYPKINKPMRGYYQYNI